MVHELICTRVSGRLHQTSYIWQKVVSFLKSQKLMLERLQLDMIWSKTLAEDFLTELFSIPRPNLVSALYGMLTCIFMYYMCTIISWKNAV